jgi:hypothetical protein
MFKLKNVIGIVLISLGLWIYASFFLYLNLFNNNQPDCGFRPDIQTWYNRSSKKPSSTEFGPDYYPQYVFDGLSWKCPAKQLLYIDLFAAGTILTIAGVIALKKGTHL